MTIPTCHPDRRHAARGLCASCYQTDWRRKSGHNQTAAYLSWLHRKIEADPSFRRRNSLYQHHRMTLEEFRSMAEAQGWRCAICGVGPLAEGDLHVDHDHRKTGRRGLLCGRCNRGIGMFDDDPMKLVRAAEYLGYKLVS